MADEALSRVMAALRQYEHQRENERLVLRLLTTIAETLEATPPSFQDGADLVSATSGDAGVPREAVPSPRRCAAPRTETQTLPPALGALLHTMARSQHTIHAALTRLSLRLQATDGRVQRLRAAVCGGRQCVRDRHDAQRRSGAMHAAALAVLSTIVRVGCRRDDTTPINTTTGRGTTSNVNNNNNNNSSSSSTTDDEETSVPSACMALREMWRVGESRVSAAVHNTLEAPQQTTCRLLRSTLLATLAARRWFPSRSVQQQRRAVRDVWYDEMRAATVADRVRWERHERTAGLVMDDEWPLCFDYNNSDSNNNNNGE